MGNDYTCSCGKTIPIGWQHDCPSQRPDYIVEHSAKWEAREADSRTAALTERLAQAERERDEWRAKALDWSGADMEEQCTLRAERDAALARVSTLEYELKNRDGGTVERLRTERDVALAKADEMGKRINRLVDEGYVWQERAEAAEKMEVEALRQRDDLRARIEALAAQLVKEGWISLAADLRALLQPPKDESALDVLSALEGDLGEAEDYVAAKLAKLRKLLEEKK